MSGLISAGKPSIVAVLLAVTAFLALACSGESAPTASPGPTTASVTAGTGSPAPSPIVSSTGVPSPTPTAVSTPSPTPTPTPIPNPAAGLEAIADTGPAPFTVEFTNLSENASSYEWDFGDGTASGSEADEPVSHEYTIAGVYEITLTALPLVEASQSSMATITITVEPGPLFELRIEPDTLTAMPTEEQLFTVIALDQFGNQISDLAHVFSADGNAGEIDDTGNFIAGTVAGSYSGAVAVEAVQGPATATVAVDISIVHGDLDHILLTPDTVELGIGEEQVFTVMALDQFGNEISDLAYVFSADDSVGGIDDTGNFTAGTVAGSYSGAVAAEAVLGLVTATVAVDISIAHGDLDHILLTPETAELGIGEKQSFSVMALDQFGNEISDLAYVFSADDNAGEIDDTGSFTAGTVAGNYPGAVAVEAAQGAVTAIAAVDISIAHGDLDHILLTPETVELEIGADQNYSAVAVDAYDNPISKAKITLSAEDGLGEIAADGTLSVGTLAGTFNQGVKVTASFSDTTAQATASVTVNPGSPAAMSVAQIELAAGETQQLRASVVDGFGNAIEGVEVTWRVSDENAGSINAAGLLTAGEVVGAFGDAIEANATIGGLTASSSVNITAGPLAQVVIAPDPVSIGMEITQQFVAVGADRYGNRIAGLEFSWTVEEGGGTINTSGLFTAGTTPGTYNRTVMATAVQGELTSSDTASVIVEPDRILFVSDRNENQSDLYLMDLEGTILERLTNTADIGATSSWSPDGRRIAYYIDGATGGINITNDDGAWLIFAADNTEFFFHQQPSWSPDGSKLAFIGWTSETRDLYVIDIDGGNLTQLTDTPTGDEWSPSWSPDGSKIIYYLRPTDGNREIRVIDAEGGNPTRLTTGGSNDLQPSFSPDGERILFTSDRSGISDVHVMNANGSGITRLTSKPEFDGRPSWSHDGDRIVFYSLRDGNREIYIISASGTNLTRVTDNEASDSTPRWAPRKRGVEVSAASVIIPNASTLMPLTAQEVNRKVGPAVVRLTTVQGASGSGFIFDSNGFLLTNNHVIFDAETITVFLEDGTTYDATVQGRDLVRDLAVLKIEATGLPMVALGDVSQAPAGTELLAIGFPLGLTGITTTSGQVSGIKYDAGSNITYVQTNTPINPGNSGGPLLDLQGNVVGVVTSRIAVSASEDFGLAVSVNTIKLYLDRLVEGEIITR